MSLFLAWIVYPAVIAVLALGCGLLLRWASAGAVPGVLLLPAGFAVVVVAASFTTMRAPTADVTTPLVVVLAVAGFGLSPPKRMRPDAWAAAAALAVFAVFAAPIVLSGAATFAGYITLDDTATWLALADNAFSHGRSVAGLAPSTYSVVLNDYLSTGYPLGSFLALGIGHQLTHQDTAWLFQPQIAFLAALLALSIYGLTAPLVRRRPLRALVAFLGAQPALLYGYAFWSGIKEMTVAALVATIAALAAATVRELASARALIPIAVVGAAVLASLAVAGGVWFVAFVLLPVLLAAAHGLRRTGVSVAVLLVVGLALAVPALAIGRRFVQVANTGDITQGATLGNLFHPLSRMQIFGIWLVGDFRARPSDVTLTYVLVGCLLVGATVAVYQAVRRRAWGVPLYLAACLGGSGIVLAANALGHGSPWLDGKALATASPALVVAGVAGAATMFEAGRRVEAAVVGAAVAAGVLWSNGLAYANVWLAPRGQLAELESIGKRYAGDGPALLTEYQPYGARHFLRKLDAESASERRARPVFLRTGGELDKGGYADIDDFALPDVLVYRTLVLRASPLASRPPSVYRLVSAGRFYEVWQRPAAGAQVLEHDSLGSDSQPVATPACGDVRRLAALASRGGGTLVAAERAPAETVDLTRARLTGGLGVSTGGALFPSAAGAATETFSVPAGGVYGLWLGGSFRDHLSLDVDGRRVGSSTTMLEEAGQLTPFGTIRLASGPHRLVLRYGGNGLRPGTGGSQFAFGPLVLGRPAATARLVRVTPAGAASLCGKELDWIEAVGS